MSCRPFSPLQPGSLSACVGAPSAARSRRSASVAAVPKATPATSLSLSTTTGPWSCVDVGFGCADGELHALGARRLGAVDKVGGADAAPFATDALGVRDAEMTGP